MENENRKKIKYTCEYCGNDIPYGSESAVSDNDYNDFCSQECFNQYHQIRLIDWSSRREYYEDTTSYFIRKIKKREKEQECEDAEKEARRKEAKETCDKITHRINDILTDRIKDMCVPDIDNK